jgi:hypothetical protein
MTNIGSRIWRIGGRSAGHSSHCQQSQEEEQTEVGVEEDVIPDLDDVSGSGHSSAKRLMSLGTTLLRIRPFTWPIPMCVPQRKPLKRESSRGLLSGIPSLIVSRDFRNLPDFEQVCILPLLCLSPFAESGSQIYHLVIDAIDTYNERWEKECKIQEAARLDRERQEELAREEAAQKIKEHREKVIAPNLRRFIESTGSPPDHSSLRDRSGDTERGSSNRGTFRSQVRTKNNCKIR